MGLRQRMRRGSWKSRSFSSSQAEISGMVFQGEQEAETDQRTRRPTGAVAAQGKCGPGILSCHSSIVVGVLL